MERVRLLVGGTLFGLLLWYVVGHFQVTTDINRFLPDSGVPEISTLSRQIADSEMSRTMVIAIEAPDRSIALRASRAFEAALRSDERARSAMSFLEGGPAQDLERSLFELYESRRLSFLAADADEARERIGDAGLRTAARHLRDELAGPLSPLVSRVAPRDPFLTILGLFERLERSHANELVVVDGRFLTEDGRTAILFLGSRESALNARAQAPLLAAIRDVFDGLSASFPGALRLDQSGLNRFATRTAEAIESDIKRVSIVSTCLISALLLVFFRSLRFIAFAAIPVGTGVLAGCASVLAVFGQLHGITLAFAASLIGVSIDYAVHLYCHQAIVSPEGGARASLHSILRPLATGAVTTLAGFAALGASSLVGLREVALFSVVGIATAFVVTITWLPSFLPSKMTEVPARRWVAARVEYGFAYLVRKRRELTMVPIAAIAFVGVVLPGVRWNPELASLARMDPELVAEDERVRNKVARVEQMRFVVAIGDDEAQALEANDVVASRLREGIAAGELAAQQSLAPLLPSPRSQRAVAAVATGDLSLPTRLRRVFSDEGFSQTAFDPFLASLAETPTKPLTLDELLASPLGRLVRSFRVRLGERIGIITFLQGVADADSIEARLVDIPGVVFLRQADLFAQAQLQYQRSTFRLMAWGLVCVLALIALRYRDLSRTLVSFVPSVLAAALTVSVLTWTGRGLNLISLTALLFVVSMGVDYSVFLVDARDDPDSKSVAAALIGSMLACASTTIAFGLLAVSDHPVLADLGLTAAVGVGTSLLLTSTMLVWVKPRRRP